MLYYALILGWKKRARMSELSPLFSLSPGTVFTLCIIVHLATGSAINDGPTLPFLQHWVFLVEYYFSQLLLLLLFCAPLQGEQ